MASKMHFQLVFLLEPRWKVCLSSAPSSFFTSHRVINHLPPSGIGGEGLMVCVCGSLATTNPAHKIPKWKIFVLWQNFFLSVCKSKVLCVRTHSSQPASRAGSGELLLKFTKRKDDLLCRCVAGFVGSVAWREKPIEGTYFAAEKIGEMALKRHMPK